jgi:cob(I)alamin adenosyltransferase
MSQDWKIYTKTGDKGETSLIGGTRVAKDHDRIEAYGTLDELNSYIGLIRDLVSDEELCSKLTLIQDRLFIAESELATDPEYNARTLPQLSEEDIAVLERDIDAMNVTIPELNSFILPGGHPYVSHCHIARCICRRAERITIRLNRNYPVDPVVMQYLNRLSDYLFVLARKLSYELGVPEIKWIPKV